MLMAIDIGNTTITMGVFQGERLCATWRIGTEVRQMPDEYAMSMAALLPMKGVALEQVNGVSMCSVVPPLSPAFEELCRSLFNVEPLVVGPGIKTGVRILYDNPHDVGTDRIVDAVAAFRLYGGPAIVVDLGTATVFDAVSETGDYLGGAIAPGIQVAAESLFTTTSQLRRVELIRPPCPIGKNTVHSMQSGLILGYVGLVEGMVSHFKDELGQDARVIATGGLSQLIAKETRMLDVVDPDLTLHGLRYIYELNHSSGS